MFTEKQIETFWSHVDKSGDCWNWTAGLDRDGYGKVKSGGQIYRAHRLAWYMTNGYTSALLRHSCDNPQCVNPTHLIEGTQKENMADMVLRGRQSVGINKKLDYNKAKAIRLKRSKMKRSVLSLAREYGVDGHTIRDVLQGKTWK